MSPSETAPMAGISRARAPLARITFLACTVRLPPAFKATTTFGAGAPFSSLASPSITSILCFFIRKAMPPDMFLATPRERSMILPKSNEAFSTDRP